MLTVLLATHDGESTLPTVLEAYQRLDAPEGGWRLVVVDNGSHDSTPQILNRFQQSLPMTRLHLAMPGKNRALNAGLDARTGDIIVFTDDDAVPSPNWLQSMRRAADRNPAFDMFGGAITPRWARDPEQWILEWVRHDVTYTITPAKAQSGPLPTTQVYGPNMAVRASLFDAGHLFDVGIGPQAGTDYAMGSETEFTLRMEQLGHKAWFVQDAVVEHLVRGFQMERAWVLSRAARYGRSIFRRERQHGEPLPRLFLGVPRWQLRRVLTRSLSLARATLNGDAQRVFEDSWHLHFDWGYLHEARRWSTRGRAP